MNYTIYSDGAASMKKIGGSYIRGAGGHAFVVYDEDGTKIFEYSNGKKETTNNEQELLAIRAALEWLNNRPDFNSSSSASIMSDSAYCVNIFNSWASSWEKNGWTRGRKHEPIENLSLIKEIYTMFNEFGNIKLEKVKGHSTCAGNIRADELAVAAKKKFQNSSILTFS